jgi:hypothetical protein
VFPKQITGIAAIVVLWVAGIAAGFGALQRYSSKAGPARGPDVQAEIHLASFRHPGRAVLVMAIHPLCPCTEASLAELGDLLARSRGACDAVLLQYHPSDGTPDWPVDTTPRVLGGVKVPVVLDRGGEIASAIGAETSGHAVLVDATGAVRFHGGLTIARGHRGRSPAQDAILDVLAGGHPTMSTAPVYGCTLECDPKDAP